MDAAALEAAVAGKRCRAEGPGDLSGSPGRLPGWRQV